MGCGKLKELYAKGKCKSCYYREYQKEYKKQRYNTDIEFRNRILERQREYQKIYRENTKGHKSDRWWKKEEEEYLINNYERIDLTIQDISISLNRPRSQIYAKASLMNLHRSTIPKFLREMLINQGIKKPIEIMD